MPSQSRLPRVEILCRDVGLLFSLHAAYRIAFLQSDRRWRGLLMLVPWAALILLLFAAGLWIVLQPMDAGRLVGGGVRRACERRPAASSW